MAVCWDCGGIFREKSKLAPNSIFSRKAIVEDGFLQIAQSCHVRDRLDLGIAPEDKTMKW
jgi:hypothetical protein